MLREQILLEGQINMMLGLIQILSGLNFLNDLKLNKEIIEQIKKLVRPGILSYLKYRLFNVY